MRFRVVDVAVLVPAMLAVALFGRQAGPVASAAPPPGSAGQAAASSPLWISQSRVSDDRQMLVIVDPNERTAAVYQLDVASGTLTLKSTRSLRWDLMVGEFNAQEPTPSALRKMIESAGPPRP